MFTLPGNLFRCCDGLSRRTFLRFGLALGGLSLPEVLLADTWSKRRLSHKAVIMVYLPGGPSHLDLFDLKPTAPAEIRGEFRAIHTNVPGIDVCEHLPRLASMMHRLVLIRSVVGGVDEHDSHLCLTGWPRPNSEAAVAWPSFGSAVSNWLGPVNQAVPSYIGVASRMEHQPYNDPGPGFLGAGHAAFAPLEGGQTGLILPSAGASRLGDRKALLATLDRFRRGVDARARVRGMDNFYQRAFDVLTSPKVAAALDLDREDPRVRDRYGPGDPAVEPTLKAAPLLTEHFLLARRLVEAGARCVSVAFGAWDWHEKNFIGLKRDLPLLDRGLSALVEDLHERGLDKDVLVVVWGEFGRSPRINKLAGRDHWPAVSCAMLAGGGLRTGRVIGSTDRHGETARDRPVHFQEVLATSYRFLGVEANRKPLLDLAGRPRLLVENHEPISELF